MGTAALERYATFAARRALAASARRLPAATVTWIRQPNVPSHSPADWLRLRLAAALRRGGIPASVRAFSLADNPSLSFVNADSLVLHQLYWFGEQGWEPELLPWWRYFCRRSSAILELGTNVGYYAVQGGRVAPHARYVAVEPHPTSAEVCRANLALNRIGSVEVIGAAAVADPTLAWTRLVVPWEQLSAPTVAFLPGGSELPGAMASRTGTVIPVPCVDVRSLLPDVDLIKIDVEGQEHALLSAGRDHLRARHPTIFVEVLPGSARLRALLVELCDDVGYRCYAPGRDELVPVAANRVPRLALQAEYGTNDLILSADQLPRQV